MLKMNSKPAIDVSLYLVTDSTPAILGERSIFAVVEEAIRGGTPPASSHLASRNSLTYVRSYYCPVS